MKHKTTIIVVVCLAVNLAAGLWYFGRFWQTQPVFQPDAGLQAALNGIADDYRKIIVLMDGAEALDAAAKARCIDAGRQIFWHKQHAIDETARQLTDPKAADGVRQLVQYLSGGGRLHEADKLAFLDLVEDVAAGQTPPGEQLQAARDDLQSILAAYREEVTRIFSQFATRGGTAKREKWDAYVAWLRTRMSREKTLSEFGGTAFEEPPQPLRGVADGEIFGNEFAPKSVALTFDDGPHPRYTEQVLALLEKYGMKAAFFELGSNLGTVTGQDVKLSRNAEIAKKVLEAGHTIANHSYSHPVLAKLSEERRTSEIESTSLLLEKVSGQKPVLFRAPYGARNKEILEQVKSEGMKSIMWTIDSQDWADPIPESIAMRVLHQLSQTHKGIVLFHDIHKQSVLALPQVIEELQRQDYTFLAYDNGKFVKSGVPVSVERSEKPPVVVSQAKHALYRESWAVIIGVNDYQNWPKLRYAVNDANGIEDALVTRFAFKRDHIRKLLNGDATRQRIMEVLGDEFTDGNRVQREDRIFFFFAGHGATRTMQDGRQVGFIIPVDADRANYYSTAISMTALREACDLIPAKHMYFVMDSCYSGLALSRGAGGMSRDRSYLEEVTRRIARQILTAGGADQQVADDGPNGHSVFTWALLQGLEGKADLDGNGVITASELGAYVSPIVSSFSKQTPVAANLVGSEGGEFIFELQPEPLTSMSQQLDNRGLKLNEQLESLQKEIAAKQEELLRLQQSIQAARGKPAQSSSAKAYDLDRQARQLYSERKYDAALEKLRQAVELKPGDAVLLNNLGFIYYRLGRYSDAVVYLQKTLAADPKRKEAYGNIGDAYLKLGQRPEAKKNYEQYLAMFPGTPRAAEVRSLLITLN
jgi:peptidoglycan/xylan/chitin deacetylase (PgdA/CDA1 family)/uncharacterized caspase-like protein